MKRNIRYLSVPLQLWTHPDLNLTEKAVLIELDSYCDEKSGTTIGAQALANSMWLPVKTLKETLKKLERKGAIQIHIDADGSKSIFVYLWKERYVENLNAVVIGDKPTDVLLLPWDEISKKWSEICYMLPKITRWSPQRKNKLRSSLKQAGLGVEDLYKTFHIVACTPFLNGASNQFLAHFDWIISKSANLQKIYEGFYCKSYQEKINYESIMKGVDITKQANKEDEVYR